VKSATLEQSNVSVVDRMAQLTEVARGFEALQRGITILMNDVDGGPSANSGVGRPTPRHSDNRPARPDEHRQMSGRPARGRP
jgi:hypothetical protein